ncbi:MAG: alkaline phosphatase family protein [Anaerolineae bacterium]
MRELLHRHRRERVLLAGYLDELDGIGHLHGPGSESWRAELRSLAYSLEREFLAPLPPGERKGTLLVLCADHGRLAQPAVSIPLQAHRDLWTLLLMPAAGSLRTAYLYARQGEREAVLGYLREHLADSFVALPANEALRAGLFGSEPPSEETLARIGDVVVLGRDAHILDYRKREHPALGMHAGASAQEMLVPLLLARLD